MLQATRVPRRRTNRSREPDWPEHSARAESVGWPRPDYNLRTKPEKVKTIEADLETARRGATGLTSLWNFPFAQETMLRPGRKGAKTLQPPQRTRRRVFARS